MKQIITEIYKILKQSNNLIEFEEQLQLLMYDTFANLVGEVFEHLNKTIKEQKQAEHYRVERNDKRAIQFTFGAVEYTRTLMYDQQGHAHYPLDEWLGFRKGQRHSPLVEVKVAELASENTYRESSKILKEWTAVDISHTTVGHLVNRVGKAQGDADKKMVQELEESASLPEGKKVDYLYAEADGVFVRSLKKKKHHEVSHGIFYEGWNKNGKRVSLKNRKVIMTTQSVDRFWQEVQTYAAHEYSLEQTQIVSNSDGGAGYSAERFRQAFSQSKKQHLHQLDALSYSSRNKSDIRIQKKRIKGPIESCHKKT